MKTILAMLLTVLLFFPVPVFGEIQTVTHTVKQPFGGSQSPDDARISAVAKAKREALEMAGTYIESLTIVKDSQVDKDEIFALSAGILKAEVVSQENYHTKDAFGIEVVVKVVVDTSVLEGRAKKLLRDRTHLTQLKEAQNKEKELLQKVALLEQENRKLMANNQIATELKKEFQQASQELTGVGWLYKAVALWDGEKYTDPGKAIEYLNNATKLQSDSVDAYFIKGFAYNELGQHQRAIENYNEIIHLKPDFAESYLGRGSVYYKLGQYQQAVEDFNNAIRLKPNFANAYNRLGYAYNNLGQHQRAIETYNESIRLEPEFAGAYNGRGDAYFDLGQPQRAIEDYNQAIRLKPDYAGAYFSRGSAYYIIDQPQRAFEDFDEAIRLKPDDAESYTVRGTAYLLRGENNLGCRDLQKACSFGYCQLFEAAKDRGDCH